MKTFNGYFSAVNYYSGKVAADNVPVAFEYDETDMEHRDTWKMQDDLTRQYCGTCGGGWKTRLCFEQRPVTEIVIHVDHYNLHAS